MPTTTHKLQLVRTFNASPDTVYETWINPEAMKVFFAPREGSSVARVEIDIRVGGHYWIQMRSPDGALHTARGVFREVVPGKKLVYTWDRPAGESCSGPAGEMKDTLITIEFKPKDNGTEMTFTHDFFPTDQDRDAHQNGWMAILDRLATY